MMKFRVFFAVALGLVMTGMATQAWAVFPDIESFDNDTDVYTPTPGVNPINDPNLDGEPPANWGDIRTGEVGVIEEVPNGFDGIQASHGGNFGIVAFEGADGPMGFPTQGASLGVPWSFRTDIYTDSRLNSTLGAGNRSYLPDFWWTNSVTDGSEYITETGFDFEIFQPESGPKKWIMSSTIGNYHSTGGGAPFFFADVDTWYTCEVLFHESTVRPGKMAADLKVWDQAHTELLFIQTQEELFLDPDFSLMEGPGYSWFVYPTPNAPTIYVDEIGVAPPIELVGDFLLGDMDNDGDVDNFDIQPFELALTDMAAWEAQYGLTDGALRGDIDGDNDFANFDIQPFEGLLTGGGPLAAAVPEPAGLALGLAGLIGLLLVQRRRTRAQA